MLQMATAETVWAVVRSPCQVPTVASCLRLSA